MRLIAICTGLVAPLMVKSGDGQIRTTPSGIVKEAVSTLNEPSKIEVKPLGVVGDEQYDHTVHGGLDKAVYMMPSEHYPFWSEQRKLKGLSTDLPWGMLGENLVCEGLSEENLLLGDELYIGDVIFRVTQPREPCYKFAVRMGYSKAPKHMVQNGCSGWYLKVIKPGTIQAGMSIQTISTGKGKTVLEQFRFLTRKGQMDLLD